MYRAEADPYCYAGTSVLINRLGLRDQTTLDSFEAEMTAKRFKESAAGSHDTRGAGGDGSR